MEHDHKLYHNSHRNSSNKKLLLATLLNLIITLAEAIGGLISNSLSLLSDALHNLGDTFAVFIAFIANLISTKDYTHKKTFGYKRIEILAALLNAVVLTVIVTYLFIEAARRFYNPEPVKGLIMLIVAVIGLLANLFSVLILRKESSHNINIRAAYLHLIGDTVSSFAVIAGGILIYFFNIYWIDPLITILIGLYLLKETFSIVRETIEILMQATPRGLDLETVRLSIENINGIDNIHHVHVWNLNDKEIHFECHVDLKLDLKVSETEEIKEKIQLILLNNFNISHVTIQYEHNCCADKTMIHSLK